MESTIKASNENETSANGFILISSLQLDISFSSPSRISRIFDQYETIPVWHDLSPAWRGPCWCARRCPPGCPCPRLRRRQCRAGFAQSLQPAMFKCKNSTQKDSYMRSSTTGKTDVERCEGRSEELVSNTDASKLRTQFPVILHAVLCMLFVWKDDITQQQRIKNSITKKIE